MKPNKGEQKDNRIGKETEYSSIIFCHRIDKDEQKWMTKKGDLLFVGIDVFNA